MPDIWFDVDAALSEVPVNILPLLDDTDFKSIEAAVAYNAAGLALYWHFVTTAGAYSVTAVTPTTGGDYDWTDQGDAGIYTIEIPASGGASINNDTEGFGWFTGVATGVLPWRGPVCGFRAAGLNDKLIDTVYSTTRGLSGTALPDAAADAAGGLPISDAGALDLDAKVGALTFTVAGDVDVNVQTWRGSAAAEMTGDAYAVVNNGTYGNSALKTLIDAIDDYIDTEIAGIVTTLGVAGAGLSAVPWNAAWDAEVQSECADALSAWTIADGDTLAANSVALWLRRLRWYVINKLAITDATGAGTVYKDDGSTPAATLTVSDDSTTTTRTGPTWA